MTLRRSTRTSHRLTTTITTVAPTVAPAVAPTASRKRTASSKEIAPPAKKSKNAASSSTVPKKAAAVTRQVSSSVDFKKPEVVATPEKKRRGTKSTPSKVPLLTPTPSLVQVLRASYSSGDIDDATPPPVDRPVEPHITNAPLVTPGGTKSLAYPSDGPEPSPTKNGLPRPIATTGTLLDKACAHLISVDARLKPIIEKHRCAIFSPEGLAEEIDPFRSLSSGIMGQQVSGAAAKSIKNKFIALFNEEPDADAVKDNEPVVAVFPTPAQVSVTPIERLRLAGLSQRKAEYIQGLAQKFVDKELTNDMLMRATDDEVMEKLIAVRGLGKWSVEMFACFGLKRLDILSTGDLGVQRGMAHFFGKDVQKLKAKGGGKWKYMSEQDMLDKSAPFAPYRSLFMWYMWRVEDVDVDVMQSA